MRNHTSRDLKKSLVITCLILEWFTVACPYEVPEIIRGNSPTMGTFRHETNRSNKVLNN